MRAYGLRYFGVSYVRKTAELLEHKRIVGA